MPPSPTWRSQIGAAKETTKGTAVVPAHSIPVGGFNPQRTPTILLDEGWRGSATPTFGSQQGKIVTEIEIDESPLFVDVFGIIALGIFGEEAISGSSPYTHAFSVLNSGDQQPPALTFTDQEAIQTRAWPGVQLSEVTITIDPDGNLTWAASGTGFADVTAATFTPAYSALLPFAGWRTTMSLNGTTVQPVNTEITISRDVEPIKTQNNSQNPFAVFAGPLSIGVSATLVAETTSHHTAFAADTQGILTITGSKGSGATTETFTLTCTKTAYEAMETDRGSSWIEYGLDLITHGNATDVGTSAGLAPGKLTLVNARSTVY